MVSTDRQQQIGLNDEVLNDAELEDLLDKRESAKEVAKPYTKRYKDADKLVKARIEQKELSDGTYRFGEFVVKISEAEEKHIEFERSSSKRISISVAKT